MYWYDYLAWWLIFNLFLLGWFLYVYGGDDE